MNNQFFSEEEALFSSLIDPKTTGLLVVDVQEKLFPHIHERDEILRRTVQAIDVVGTLELPILVTEQYVRGLGPSLPQIKEALERYNAYNPIEKFDFSCFGEPKFESALEASGIETLVIVGIETHVCVMQTALQAMDRGIEVFFISEAIGSRSPDHKSDAINRLREAGATIGSVEMLAFEIMRTSKHPKFKSVQKFIV